jgi:hypothetical protein
MKATIPRAYHFLCVLLVLLHLVVDGRSCQSQDSNPNGERVNAQSRREVDEASRREWEGFRKRYQGLFASADQQRLRCLQAADDVSTSIQSAWEEVVRATGFASCSLDASKERRDRCLRFVGFIEGRGRCHCPEWWVNFLTNRAKPNESWYHETSVPWLLASADTRVSSVGESLYVSSGGDAKRLIPLLKRSEFTGQPTRISSGVGDGFNLFVIFDPAGRLLNVKCFDRESVEPKWSREVFGCNNDVLFIGPPPEAWVSLECRQSEILIFGAAAGDEMFVRSMDCITGETKFQFSTEFAYDHIRVDD